MSIAASRVPGFWSALFLILCVYVVFAPGTVAGIDPNARWDTARALWSRGTLSIGERTEEASLIKRFGYTVHPSRRGAFMHFGLGQSLLMIPFDIPVVAMAPFLYPAEPRFAEKLLMSLTFFPFVSALACALLYGLLRELNTPWRPALATTALASFATALLPYSQIHQEEPLLACCPLAACWLVARSRGHLKWSVAVAVSAVSAFGAVIRLSFGVGFVALAVFTLAAASRARDRASCHRVVGAFVIAGVGLCAWWLTYNMIRFEAPFETGYGLYVKRSGDWHTPNVAAGILGPWLAPGKSVLLFSPAVALGLWALAARVGRAKVRAIGLLGLVLFVLNTLVVGMTPWWGGDWCWGSRYQVHTLPLLVAPAAGLFEDGLMGWRRKLIGAVAIVGVLVQMGAGVLRLDLEYSDVEPRGDRPWSVTESQLPARAAHVARLLSGNPPLGRSAQPLGDDARRSLNSPNLFPFRLAAKVGWTPLAGGILALWGLLVLATVWLFVANIRRWAPGAQVEERDSVRP